MMDPKSQEVQVYTDIDQLCINTIRFLSVDAVQKANSGHPGLPLDAAPMAYVLWTRYLKFNPQNPDWFDRDRFVLSAGHGSMLLYSILHLTGYDISMEQIKQFRQFGSITPGHPERELTPGVETTTGPLGQGFGNAVGMAIAEAYLASRYNRPGLEIVKHYIYCLVSDGDLMEGVSSEAASLAGHLKLGKLISMYDCNHVTLSASTQISFTDDHRKRFESYNWHVQIVEDGNDLDALDASLKIAREETNRPSLIIVRTHLGYGSPNKQDTFEAHGSPLGQDEVKLTKEKLGWPADADFFVPDEARELFLKSVERGRQWEDQWNKRFEAYEKHYSGEAKEIRQLIDGELPEGWDSGIPKFQHDPKGIATRVASGKIMNAISPALIGLIGGSADLNPSTHTELKDAGNFGNSDVRGDLQGSVGGGWSYAGKNIFFGVREHAMGAILNGLSVPHGMIPFGATFLTFSDYMRPAIRLASLMQAHVVYVFTHDSISLGEDGPTHQSVEHLAALRAIPGLTVIRPADANETAEAWRVAIKARNPVALILSRQNIPVLDRKEFASAEGLVRGAYILADPPQGKPHLILISTGSEVSLIVAAQKKLSEMNIAVRLISMPSWELFDDQSNDYKNSVIPHDIPARLAVEAGITMGWRKYVGDAGVILGIDHFGASAPGPVVMKEFGFTVENVVDKALALLNTRM
jgi:transketolase